MKAVLPLGHIISVDIKSRHFIFHISPDNRMFEFHEYYVDHNAKRYFIFQKKKRKS